MGFALPDFGVEKSQKLMRDRAIFSRQNGQPDKKGGPAIWQQVLRDPAGHPITNALGSIFSDNFWDFWPIKGFFLGNALLLSPGAARPGLMAAKTKQKPKKETKNKNVTAAARSLRPASRRRPPIVFRPPGGGY